jgi:hypothetical protein
VSFLAACQAYVSYKVLTRTSAPGYREQAEVIRRFRDFTWLQHRLRREYRGEKGCREGCRGGCGEGEGSRSRRTGTGGIVAVASDAGADADASALCGQQGMTKTFRCSLKHLRHFTIRA